MSQPITLDLDRAFRETVRQLSRDEQVWNDDQRLGNAIRGVMTSFEVLSSHAANGHGANGAAVAPERPASRTKAAPKKKRAKKKAAPTKKKAKGKKKAGAASTAQKTGGGKPAKKKKKAARSGNKKKKKAAAGGARQKSTYSPEQRKELRDVVFKKVGRLASESVETNINQIVSSMFGWQGLPTWLQERALTRSGLEYVVRLALDELVKEKRLARRTLGAGGKQKRVVFATKV